MNKFLLFFISFFALSSSSLADDVDKKLIHCYQTAYPNMIEWNGKEFVIKNHNQLVNISKDILEMQISQKYPRDFSIPKKDFDPGRFRSFDFFSAIYGSSKKEIESNLVSLVWKPSGKTIRFNRKNNAAMALQKVGEEIANHPTLLRYVSKTNGTFNYRKIVGTMNYSPHAFGIAIDFVLPDHLGMYWQWSNCKPDKDCDYPAVLIKNPLFNEVIKIFEKHGFIWGGKWYHYDSVHFEYRPELLNLSCLEVN